MWGPVPGVGAVVLQEYFKRSLPSSPVPVQVVVTLPEVDLLVVLLRPLPGVEVVLPGVVPGPPPLPSLPSTL